MSEIHKRTIEAVTSDMAEKGWSHVDSGIDPSDTVAIRSLFVAMGERLTINQKIKPEISVIAPKDNTRVLAATSKEMSFHTDNVYLDDPCKSIALFCAVQAEEGGVNELVDGFKVARTLPEDAQRALAEEKWRWANPASKEPSAEFAVLDNENESLRWWRMSLLNKEMGSVAIADMFEDALNNSPDREAVLMQPGDLLVTDNTRILHNRSAFVGDRRVYRARFW